MEVPKWSAGSYILGSLSTSGTLTGVTSGTSIALDCEGSVRDLTFYIEGTGTISAGTLVIEEAADKNYTGTFSQIGASVDLTTLTGSGACVAVHVHGCFGAVRVRTTANVTGASGAIAVRVVGN